jgi:hypothetical protein
MYAKQIDKIYTFSMVPLGGALKRDPIQSRFQVPLEVTERAQDAIEVISQSKIDLKVLSEIDIVKLNCPNVDHGVPLISLGTARLRAPLLIR